MKQRKNFPEQAQPSSLNNSSIFIKRSSTQKRGSFYFGSVEIQKSIFYNSIMTLSREVFVGEPGKRNSKITPPAEWVGRLKALKEIPGLDEGNIDWQSKALFGPLRSAAKGSLVARIIVTDSSLTLTKDIRNNGVVFEAGRRYYHRELRRPGHLEDLLGLQGRGRIQIAGFFMVVPKTQA